METCCIQTIIGLIEIIGDENGISSVKIGKQIPISTEIPTVLQEAVTQLKEFMAGERQVFDLNLNPTGGTELYRAIWKELHNIPYGETISYLELARRMGMEKAFRAVATGIGKNPILILIPCHRVINSKGKLAGYAGGLSAKKWLLEEENPIVKYDLV